MPKKYSLKLFFLGCLILSVIGCQSVNVKKVEVKEVITAKLSDETRPIKLSKLIVKMKRGEVWGSEQLGLLCIPSRHKLKWRTGRVNVTSELLDEMFRQAFEDAGYSVAGNPDDLFEKPDAIQTDYYIGGLIKDMKANICYPMAGFMDFATVKGEAYMEVEWQIFDTLEKEVIKTVTTEGSFELNRATSDYSGEMILEEAFGIAVNNLLANREITDMLVSAPEHKKMDKAHEITTHVKFNENQLTSFQENVTAIRAAVATVRSSNGHGSGFFIGEDDGYMLTNQHVVGNAKFVKIILSSGREMVGDIIKVDKSRDIALIKTENAGITSLPFENKLPSISETVYAVGSPLKEEFETTVSQGIVSGFRDLDGQNFIQSDVNVLPGNSGGPLLNDKGNVIGITVSGRLFRGVPSGINFFIPIKSALEALNVKSE